MIEDGFEYAKMTMTMKVMRMRVTMPMMMMMMRMMMRMAPPGRQIWSRLMEVFAAMQPGSDPFTPLVDNRHTQHHGCGGEVIVKRPNPCFDAKVLIDLSTCV